MSAQESEIGRLDLLRRRVTAATGLGKRKTRPLELQGLTRVGEGPEVLRHLSVIENEATCTTAACHAHPAERRVLGVLDVEMSMAPSRRSHSYGAKAASLDHVDLDRDHRRGGGGFLFGVSFSGRSSGSTKELAGLPTVI